MSGSDLSPIGVWLLVGSVVAIVLEMVVGGMMTARVAKRSRQLSELLATEGAAVRADLARLKEALDETQRLWQPYARALKWLRHPLVVAMMESYARRRARA
ncbi:MAG TPA: hypothetical protein VET26_06580 [Candidatus Sulfotelmatobacter sp.]|nr:hypothetical protein [Candidatus Sulfotelmatobacter sp.]